MFIPNSFKGYSFGPGYRQVFQNKPVNSLLSDEILRMRHSGSISDEDLRVVKFILKFKFTVPEVVADFLGEDFDAAKARLDRLVKCRIINRFMLSRLQVDTIEKEALMIYSLDLGGKILLSQFADTMEYDVSNWTVAKTYWSSENIGNDLVTSTFYGKVAKDCPNKLVHLKADPEYRITKQLVIPSFELCFNEEGGRRYYVGQVVRDHDIPLAFREQALKLESIFCTKAWLKYFYDLNEAPPLLIIADSDEVALECARILSTTTSIGAFRITTDERLKKSLTEPGTFMKYDSDSQILKPIKTAIFTDRPKLK